MLWVFPKELIHGPNYEDGLCKSQKGNAKIMNLWKPKQEKTTKEKENQQ